ncbi:response regulator transcription factor [Streptococcus equinus]|uniref:Transcriptional regulatory protein DltR n=1 Tax=Streptococcus equinus TaxID=1335 RepID=A0A1G9LH09_STREI|nr:response regulator transcription factor [Streptococcus equinus]SDL61250.1 two-component system, OmpR family, response regulator VanR/two-component system, OmpR family, response regulator Irr [Streptococcus equinus]SEI67776.1 two-component system, OmpR family, response regulator VanR/two-component system, OmpR family, response regulator Irr [Streptococcus equinus]
MPKILIVEDDCVINQVISEFLKEQNYETISCFDGQDALNQVKSEEFDLIILDIMIPTISGLDVLKKIREYSDIPIMMLTAMDDEYTQLVSFNHKINDYVIKPFSPLILTKRIENILRQLTPPKKITIGTTTIDLENCTVYSKENIVPLTKTEYDILSILAKRSGKLVTRDNLMYAVWGYPELDSRVLDNHIKNIRKKLPHFPLTTVVGRGYKLEINE